jgi:hypothetical protein
VHYGGGSSAHHAVGMIYQAGSKIGLMRRHLTPFQAGFATLFLIFAYWLRARLYGLVARLRPARFGKAAAAWGEAWRRRSEWRDGPSRSAVTRAST